MMPSHIRSLSLIHAFRSFALESVSILAVNFRIGPFNTSLCEYHIASSDIIMKIHIDFPISCLCLLLTCVFISYNRVLSLTEIQAFHLVHNFSVWSLTISCCRIQQCNSSSARSTTLQCFKRLLVPVLLSVDQLLCQFWHLELAHFISEPIGPTLPSAAPALVTPTSQ